MSVKEKALEYHANGCNCAQSVLCALGEYTALDEETAKRVSAGFGGGARCGELCGAAAGAVMALGVVEGAKSGPDGKPGAPIAVHTAELAEAFKAEFGCIRCQELKEKFDGKSHCNDMIQFAADAAEKIIRNI